ncbi:MAG: hypothetical protein Roseis2KO_00890 [Roseivirga sp.]
MSNPFKNGTYNDAEDNLLLDESIAGDITALDQLIKKHQPFIYNVALRMVNSSDDAWDITQEVLIKVITNLASFKRKSSFRTWLYRIVINHFFSMKKRGNELTMSTLDALGNNLAQIPDHDYDTLELQEKATQIEEMKVRCTTGMLVCLTRDQRLAYILGEVFEADHNIGATIMDITPNNFRVKLSRARKDLHHFINDKCGLINKKNPCRCRKKTKFAIDNGFINPDKPAFILANQQKVRDVVEPISLRLEVYVEEKYQQIYHDQPFHNTNDKSDFLTALLKDPEMKAVLQQF